MAAEKWTDDKTFRFRNDPLWTGLKKNTSYGQKHFRETNNMYVIITSHTRFRVNLYSIVT